MTAYKHGIAHTRPRNDVIADMVSRIDTVVDAELACANCGRPRHRRDPSPYFCGEDCAKAWACKANRVPVSLPIPNYHSTVQVDLAADQLRDLLELTEARVSRAPIPDRLIFGIDPAHQDSNPWIVQAAMTAEGHTHISYLRIPPAPRSRIPAVRWWRAIRGWLHTRNRRAWFTRPPTSS